MVILVNSGFLGHTAERKQEGVSVIAEEGGSSWVSSSCIELNFVCSLFSQFFVNVVERGLLGFEDKHVM